MKLANHGLYCLLLVVTLLSGCAEEIGSPPQNLDELRLYHGSGERPYPKYVILRHNIQRILDGERPAEERVKSLKLVNHLGGDDPEARSSIALILAEPKAPSQLHQMALTFLMKRGSPDLARHLMKAWPTMSSDNKQSALKWMAQHPDPRVLAEIVKLWAKEPLATGAAEKRFRQVVDKITGKPWDQALLNALNTATFFARGSAIEILSRRLSTEHLSTRISRMTAKTPPVVALKFFIDRFGYLPRDRNQLVSAVTIWQTQQDMLPYAERLSNNWQRNEKYEFSIRDFHLLSRLARDPLRGKLDRRQLTDKLSELLDRRQHALNGRVVLRGNFRWVAAKLTMTDLWNIYLLNEMLSRQRVQLAIRIMAEGDRVDKRSRWGGLIFYENGQGEAKLYAPDRSAGENDVAYVPTKRLIGDGRDSMCRFVAHFEKLSNLSLAGPTKNELLEAQRQDYYALVLTSTSEHLFSAHYYNPRGQVVSLGLLPFRK